MAHEKLNKSIDEIINKRNPAFTKNSNKKLTLIFL